MAMSKEATFVLGLASGAMLLRMMQKKQPPPNAPKQVAAPQEAPKLPADIAQPAVRVRKVPAKAVRA